MISQKDAKAQGLKRYFTGKPCKRGHVAERWVSSGECTECSYARCLAWQMAYPEKSRAAYRAFAECNPEKIRAYSRAYYAANPEKCRARRHAWTKSNSEKCRARWRAWAKANPAKSAAKTMRRYAQKLNATPLWACQQTITDFYTEAQYQGMHVDHIIPLKHPLVCGLHIEHNLQLLTPAENRLKHNLFVV